MTRSSKLPFLAVFFVCASLSAAAQSELPTGPIANPERVLTTTVQTAPSGIITAVAGDGYVGDGGNGGPATKAQLIFPQAVAVDDEGNIFIADPLGEVVRKVTASTGDISIYAGTGEGGYSGDNGPAVKAELNVPQYIAVDSANNLYISDERNNVIRKVNAKTRIITTVVGNGLGAGPSGFSGICPAARVDNVLATDSPLCTPFGLAVDAKNNIYFADFDNNVVRKVTAATGIITTVAGNGGVGYAGDGGPAVEAILFAPTDVAVDSAGNLYITDALNCAIRKVTVKTGIITSLVGTPSPYGYGLCGDSGAGGPASAAEIGSFPFGIAVNKSGNVFISDQANNLIWVIEVSSGKIYQLAGTTFTFPSGGLTHYGSLGDGGPAAYALLDYPAGIGLDSSGNLYIADADNRAIRKVTDPGAPPTEAPAISPASGAITEPTLITITAPVAGSTIYYTMDGTIPTTSSSKYTAPFSVDKTSILTAFATVPGKPNSPATISSYIFAPPPVIAPGSSTIAKPVKVSITDSNPEATIYYTLDGSQPASFSKTYTGPITISSTTNLQAAAEVIATTPAGQQFYAWSATTSATYTNPAAKAPSATTSPATGISSYGATLNGTIVANNATTTYTFLYGTSLLINSTYSSLDITGTTSTAVYSDLTGLQPNTTYSFKLVATNAMGTQAGNIQTFTTK